MRPADKPPSPPIGYRPGDPVCACGTVLHRYRDLTQCQDCEDLARRQSAAPAQEASDRGSVGAPLTLIFAVLCVLIILWPYAR